VTGKPTLLGIVNVTEDSFSDGGRYIERDAALSHARVLAAQGADVIDLGAAASNPDAKPVSPELEIERLAPLVDALAGDGLSLSIDSFAPETQCWALARGVKYLNDVQGFARPEIYPALAASQCRLIVMHALQGAGQVDREERTPDVVFDRILAFFEARIAALCAAGIARHRLILDPGMGFFLGGNPEISFFVLRRISELKKTFDLPVLVSVSRKSFLRAVTGRAPADSGPATLAAELFAVGQGADYVRTHEPAPLVDALAVMQSLGPAEAAGRADLVPAQVLQRFGENPLL
jgi:dihydropteroate synthase type 2